MVNDKEILTLKEAAKYLGIGKASMYKLVRTENIPHRRIFIVYRFDKEALKKWVQGDFDW